jgi:hypothetical protein
MLELFDESHFFMCSGGLKPARFKANQNKAGLENGNYFLTEQSLICKGVDFCCKYAALIAAILAAALVLLLSNPAGWVVLAALGAAIGGAVVGTMVGGAICGFMAASFRSWNPNAIKIDETIENYRAVANRPGTHLTCKAWFGQQITYVPNVKSEGMAWLLFGCNILATGLQGFMYAYAGRGVGLLIKAPASFFCNFATNFIRSWGPTGVLFRGLFAGYGTFNAHYMSKTEGSSDEERRSGALNGGLFLEMALFRLATRDYEQEVYNPETGQYEKKTNWEGVFNDVGLLLSFGGVPAGGKGQDATNLADVTSAAKQGAIEWRHPVETVKAEAGKVIETAKQFREQLKKLVDGKGAHENTFDISNYKMGTGEKLGDFGERVVRDMLENQGYDKFYQVQNNSGNGVDIVAQNTATGDIIIAEVKSTQQLRLWDSGNMKDLPMSDDQQAGGEAYSNDRLSRAANEEDGYTDGRSTAEAQEAQEAIGAAKESGANIEYYKYDVYVDENGIPRAEPHQRPWEAPVD